MHRLAQAAQAHTARVIHRPQRPRPRQGGAQFPCFTGKKVPVLKHLHGRCEAQALENWPEKDVQVLSLLALLVSVLLALLVQEYKY